MIYNESFFLLMEQAEKLAERIIESKSFRGYKQAKENLDQDSVGQMLKADFLEKKHQFEKISAYGTYAPSFKESQQAVRKSKRTLDLHESVAEFRFCETQLQGILDEIGMAVAHTISEEIIVETGNPFFEQKKSCGGQCHAG